MIKVYLAVIVANVVAATVNFCLVGHLAVEGRLNYFCLINIALAFVNISIAAQNWRVIVEGFNELKDVATQKTWVSFQETPEQKEARLFWQQTE